MKTPLGQYVIFDITEFLPGRPIPQSFLEEAEAHGPWFFQPALWSAANCWGGSTIAEYMGEAKSFPILYSIGFHSEEAALEAATAWEAKDPDRHRGKFDWTHAPGVYQFPGSISG